MESRVLEHWGDFYLLLGTAAAALLALLFVAVSLGVGFLTEERTIATRTFMSPVVIHFTSVFFAAAIAMVPPWKMNWIRNWRSEGISFVGMLMTVISTSRRAAPANG